MTHEHSQLIDPSLNFASPAFFEDPYSYYAKLRESDPVNWNNSLGSWLVTDYSLVDASLRDPRLSANRKQSFFDNFTTEERERTGELESFFQQWLMFMDPPAHDRLKGLLARNFSQRAIQRYAESTQAVSQRVAKNLKGRGSIDFLHEFAVPVSTNTLATMLGVKPEEYGKIVHWSEDLLNFLSNGDEDKALIEGAVSSHESLKGYIQETVEEKRRNQKEGNEDIVGVLGKAVTDGKMTDNEMVAVVANLLVDGHEPISNTLSNGMIALIDNPQQLALLRSQPELIGKTVEEILRFNPFFQFVARKASEDIALGSRIVKKGQKVKLMVSAANRDPRVFDKPNEFDIQRSPNRHLALGQGIHFCLGSAVGRLTTSIALNAFLQENPTPTLTEKPTWKPSVGYRGVNSLALNINS